MESESCPESPGEGSSCRATVEVKVEVEEDDNENSFNTMDFLEIAGCKVEAPQEPIDFNSNDAVVNPKTGCMVCLLCLLEVDTQSLQSHMVAAHAYRRMHFKCHVCKSVFRERPALHKHREVCQPVSKRKVQKSLRQLIKEVELLAAQDYFESGTCPVCMIEMPRGDLKNHLIAEHGGKPDPNNLDCPTCKRHFKTPLTLREHIRLVHELVEAREECELCGQRFRSQKYLGNHKRNVHPVAGKQFECECCGKVFKSRLCLHQHRKYVHPPASAAAQCGQCGKLFKTRVNLQQHVRVSHGTS